VPSRLVGQRDTRRSSTRCCSGSGVRRSCIELFCSAQGCCYAKERAVHGAGVLINAFASEAHGEFPVTPTASSMRTCFLVISKFSPACQWTFMSDTQYRSAVPSASKRCRWFGSKICPVKTRACQILVVKTLARIWYSTWFGAKLRHPKFLD
jgi:hypothetical protein